MLFFLVGGVEHQAGRVLQQNAGRCIRCGSAADLVEQEKVLKLFFVPVKRWPAKESALLCRNPSCSFLFPQSSLPPPEDSKCGACGSRVHSAFRFCPFCGSAL